MLQVLKSLGEFDKLVRRDIYIFGDSIFQLQKLQVWTVLGCYARKRTMDFNGRDMAT
jgi:hypothetical protein